MRRSLPIVVIILLLALMAMVVWVSNRLDFPGQTTATPPPAKSEIKPAPPAGPTAAESLLTGYGDPSTPPHRGSAENPPGRDRLFFGDQGSQPLPDRRQRGPLRRAPRGECESRGFHPRRPSGFFRGRPSDRPLGQSVDRPPRGVAAAGTAFRGSRPGPLQRGRPRSSPRRDLRDRRSNSFILS